MGGPWTDIDQKAPRPSLLELRTSQQRVRFKPARVVSTASEALMEAFRSMADNGGAHLAGFTVEDVDDAGHWFLSRNRFEEYEFGRLLIASDGLAAALPEVVRGPAVARGAIDKAVSFSYVSPLTLDGDIAARLTWGGPYTAFPGTGADAKRLGVAFANDIIGDRYDDFRVDRTSQRWSPWFFGNAWDDTWVITDKRSRRVTMICVTDVD